jgi:TonB-linked SusC/RagA family outer membrane protein
MKLRIVLFIVLVNFSLFLASPSCAQTVRVSLDMENKTIEQVMDEIEKQSEFYFIFNQKQIDVNRIVTIQESNKPISEILPELFKGTGVNYVIIDRKILLTTDPIDSDFVSSLMLSDTQQKLIVGTVTGTDGSPIPYVNVVIKGTTLGSNTNNNGLFSITVPSGNDVLVFSFVGYLTQEVAIGSQTEFNIVLKEETTQLNDIVVTALGIKREKKALSYASQQIPEEELSKVHSLNFIGILSGRTAGIDLRRSNAGAGGSTKILLRGTKSFYGTSQPLIVIDGIPMANYQTSDASGFWSGVDSGDGLSNLNPDDIESINILKGSNAAALYGSQGSNGVVIINTKKGEKGKTKIGVSSGIFLQDVSILPVLQTSYGQTAYGALDSWGTKGSYSNPVNGFFKTGIDLSNSVSISGGNDLISAYISFANARSEGVMPTNKFNKNNLTFTQTSQFYKNLKISSNIMFVDQQINNKVLSGYYYNPLTGLYLFPRGLDFNYYKENYEIYDPARNIMTQNWFNIQDTQQNPYWILNNNANTESTKRVLGNINFEIKISKSLTFQARGNYDITKQIFEQKIKAGTASTLAPANGRWIHNDLTSTQQYGDMLLNYNTDIKNTFDIHGLFGLSYQKRIIGDGTKIDSDRSGLIVPNEFFLNNLNLTSFNGVLASVMTSRDLKKSVFANLSVGYRKMFYFDFAGRNEWSSTLANTIHDSYFYPSVGISAILNEIFTLPSAISFAKLRSSYSYVGKEIPAFMTIPLNKVDPVDGIILNTEMPYRDLKPEIQHSLEIGAELKLFGNRIGFDATFYLINNLDEFLRLEAPAGSGYTTYFINPGHIRNKGIEIIFEASPFDSENLKWKTSINYSKNSNKIIKLDPSLKGRFNPDGGGEGFDMFIAEGGSIGDIYVNAYQRDDATGKIILDDSNLPTMAVQEKLIGSANPDFSIGWNNTITCKNFSFSFLIDCKFGGKFVDMTEAWYDQAGLSVRSADARDAGGVEVSGMKADGTPVTTIVDAKSYYTRIGGRAGFVEPYVYDATNVRLRQVIFTYNLNLKKRRLLIENASFSLSGQNLFFFFRKAPFDPDNTISTGINTQSVESFSLPPTRSVGFNIVLNY